MANNQGFNPASGQLEQFLFSTINVAPTNAADVPQSGVEPGFPEPDATNLSPPDVTVGVAGSLRQNAESDPTVRVRIVDFGRITDAPLRARQQLQKGDDAVTVADVRQTELELLRFTHIDQTVPRISIQRSDYSELDGGADTGETGIRLHFDRWPTSADEIDAVPPSAPNQGDPWLVSGIPKLILDAQGRLQCWFIASIEDTQPYLVVKYYDPTEAHEWQDLCDFACVDILGGTWGTSGAVFDCAPFRRGDEMCVAIGGQLSTPRVAVLQMLGHEPGEIEFFSHSQFQVNKSGIVQSLAAVHTAAGTLIAADWAASGAGITFALSQDLREWNKPAGTGAAFAALSEARIAQTVAGDVTDVQASSATDMQASTTTGAVRTSADAGATWMREDTPTTADRTASGTGIRLHSVCRVGDNYYAVGDNGTILRKVGAAAWKAIRSPSNANPLDIWGAAGDYEAAEVAKTDVPNRRLNKIRGRNDGGDDRLWICGANGFLAYSSDNGSTWLTIADFRSKGAYRDFVVSDEASSNTMIAVGELGVHDGIVFGADVASRALLLPDATTATPTGRSYILPITPTDFGHLTAIDVERTGTAPGTAPDLINAGAVMYAVSSMGVVYRINGTGASVTSTQIASLLSRAAGAYTDIQCPPGTTNTILIAGPRGAVDGGSAFVWQSTDANLATANFVSSIIDGSPTQLYLFTVSTGVIGTDGALLQLTTAAHYRALPDFLVNPDGSLVLTVCNVTNDIIEVYYAPRPSPGAIPAFRSIGEGYKVDDGDKFHGSLSPTDNGSIVMTVGTKARIGLANGQQWTTPDSALVPLAVGDVPLTDPDYTEVSDSLGRRHTRFYRSRLWSVAPSSARDKIATWTAWEWDATGTQYRPLPPGVKVWVGIDDLSVVSAGMPAIGDAWTIRPRYGYRVGHIVSIDSPEIGWRSKNDDDTVTIEWDRANAGLVEEIGAGALWNANGFSLFGTNFRQLTPGISDPGESSTFTQKVVSNVVAFGDCEAPGGLTTTNIIRDPDKTGAAAWTPGQFCRGLRNWYCAITSPLAQVRRIVGNGSNYLELDGNVTLAGAGDTYEIYGDRFYWDGTAGTGPGSGGLRGTDYEFGQIVRVRMTPQVAYGGYFGIGKALIGVAPEPDAEARSFLYGSQWSPITNTEQDVGKSGIKTVRHYGRSPQLWSFRFAAEKIDARTRKLGRLLERMRQPFALLMNPSDPLSVELVRLVDAVKYTQIQASGTRFDSEWLLEEVA